MKTLWILLLALMPVIVFAQDEEDETVLPQEVAISRNEAIAQGIIPMSATPVWAAMEQDMGMLDAGKDITYTFVVKNVGSAPLQIKNVKTRNTSVVATYTQEPIVTGTSGNVVVVFKNPPAGNFTEYITVFTNAESGADVLSLMGQVIMPVAEAK